MISQIGKPGPASQIPPDIEAAILAALESTPKAVGDGIAVNGEARVLQAFLADRYPITMQRGALRKGLKRKGFTGTRPTYPWVKADPAKPQAVREELDTLKKT